MDMASKEKKTWKSLALISKSNSFDKRIHSLERLSTDKYHQTEFESVSDEDASSAFKHS